MQSELNNNFYKTNSFFFFLDQVNKDERKLLSVDRFFGRDNFFLPIKYFLHFSNKNIDFNFLEENYRLIFFFIFFNKIFFKDQIKNIKKMLSIEKDLSLLKIKFYLNFYFFFQKINSFVFLLKYISLLRFHR